MPSVFQSPFLQALGFAIANSLWQTALVWGLFMIVNSLVSLSASMKYRLALFAQLISFAWFLVTLQFYDTQYRHAWQDSAGLSAGFQEMAVRPGSASSQLIGWMTKTEQFLPYISLAYLFLICFLCIRWGLGFRQTMDIRHSGIHKIPVEWRLFIKKAAAQMGIRKNIRIYLSDKIASPLTMGFLKPIILIPVASINHLSTDQLEAVLLHELAHIRRYDYLVNMIVSVVEIALFFNPFTQLISKSIRKERENSCDDWVLQFQYNASVYAEALLRIACLQTAPVYAMAAATCKKNDLLHRVKRMLDKKEVPLSYRKQLLALLIVTGLLVSLAWLNPVKSPSLTHRSTWSTSDKKVQKINRTYAVEPMAVSIDNPLFNPVFFLSKPLKAEMKKNIAAAQKEVNNDAEINTAGDDELVASISPMVAGALELASKALAEEKINTEKRMVQAGSSVKELETAFKDSLFIAGKMKNLFSKEMANSFRNASIELRNAQTEIQKALKMKAETAIDQEKVQQDIKKAMQELEKLQLGKLVAGAFKIPATLMNPENTGSKRKLKTTTPPQIDFDMEEDKPLPAQPKTELSGKTSILSNEDAILIEENAETADNHPRLAPLAVKLPDLSPLEAIRKMRVNNLDELKLKALLLKLLAEKRLKIIPAISVDKSAQEEAKLVIQFQ